MDELDKQFQEAEVCNQQNIEDAVKKAKEEILAAIWGLTMEETSQVNSKQGATTTGGSRSGTKGRRKKLCKVELPIFNSEDAPGGWAKLSTTSRFEKWK